MAVQLRPRADPASPARRVAARPGAGLRTAAALALCMVAGAAWAQEPAVTLPQPDMAGPLSFPSGSNPVPLGALGTWHVDGVLSALGLAQSRPVSGDRAAVPDVSNAQILVQKVDGPVQFYVQLGAYSIPSLGVQYARLTESGRALGAYYSAFPQGFVRVVPADGFDVEAGKLPTLIGPEDTFTFENVNVERGLLWNQEPSVSRGVQADLTLGPVVVNLSLNDGFYSDRLTWVSGAVTWTADTSDTLAVQGGANLGRDGVSTPATPLPQNDGSIVDLVYTLKSGRLTVTPYLQYTHAPAAPRFGLPRPASSYGAALLASVPLDDAWSLGGRAEYIATRGRQSLLYGPGSAAASFTLTPTYAPGRFFARADVSAVAATGVSAGSAFGSGGRARQQLRAVLETGVLF